MAINGSDGDDLINGTNGQDIINGLEGNDTLNGGDWNDQLFGATGNDVLDGGTGADTLSGGVGNDTYIVDDVGDQISESSTILDNADTVISTISWTLGEKLENLTLIGDADINGTGNELDNNLVGNAGNNILNGGDGDDFINGGVGDDTLDGGIGSDLLQGGFGSDSYIVDNLGDRINDFDVANGYDDGGDDRVYSSVTWTLGDYLEGLTLTGNDAINGTGNALNNELVGNQFNNLLFGGDGNDYLWGGSGGRDTLNGGSGNDSYTVDADDIINEDPNAGIDTVSTLVSWTLGTNLENLVLDGVDAIDGVGNELDNNIRGNFGANALFGGAGNDRILGLDGDDVLDSGDGDDIVFGGDGSDILYGGAGNDKLYGNAGSDSILGTEGNDILVGGVGDDVLTGGDEVDRFVRVYSTTGVDTITDFQVGEDLLCFSARGFGGDLLKRSVLDESQFTLGTAATDTSDRFIYDNTTGALFFDVDGTGANQQVQIATLQAGLALNNTDIYIMA